MACHLFLRCAMRARAPGGSAPDWKIAPSPFQDRFGLTTGPGIAKTNSARFCLHHIGIASVYPDNLTDHLRFFLKKEIRFVSRFSAQISKRIPVAVNHDNF